MLSPQDDAQLLMKALGGDIPDDGQIQPCVRALGGLHRILTHATEGLGVRAGGCEHGLLSTSA